jgi:hypothetical protein
MWSESVGRGRIANDEGRVDGRGGGATWPNPGEIFDDEATDSLPGRLLMVEQGQGDV